MPRTPQSRWRRPDPTGLGAAIGRRVREIRQARGWTQSDLVQASGLSLSYITKLESGYVRSPQWATIQRLATVLEVPVERLLGQSTTDVPHGETRQILAPVELRLVARRLRQVAAVLLEMAERVETLERTSQESLRRLLSDLDTAVAAYGDRPIQAQDILAVLKAEVEELIGGGGERDPGGAADLLRPARGD